MGIYTMRLLIHGVVLTGIIYITLDASNFKLLISNALIYLLPFTLDFNKRSLPKDFYPKRYKIGKYIVGTVLFVIFIVMFLNYLGLAIHIAKLSMIILRTVFILIYLTIGFIVLLDWYILKDTEETFTNAENAGRDSVRDRQIATNERQRSRKLKQKHDYEKHVSKMSQKKTRKK